MSAIASSGWIRFTRSNPCPVCGEGKECRQSRKTEIIFCRAGVDNPGFKFLGEDQHGFGMFIDRAIADSQAEADREEWLRRKEKDRALQQEAERRRAAASMPEQERHRNYTKLLSWLSLKPEHQADLRRRGLTDEQIDAAGYKSVEQWQRLPEPLPLNLPGVLHRGRSLNVPYPGYLCPVWNDDGLIAGFQPRSIDAGEEAPKYYWLTSRTEKNPEGATPNLPNGEMPLARFSPRTITRDWIAFSEGTGPKPHLASIRLGCSVVGAAGGNFAGSPSQVQAALASGRIPVLLPDGGAIANSHVMGQYAKLATIVPDLKVLWWGQWSKGQDVDEVSDQVLGEARLITWEEFRGMSSVGDRPPRTSPLEPDPIAYSRHEAEQEEAERVERAQRKQEVLDHIERCFKRSIRPSKSFIGKGFGQNTPQRAVEATVDPAAGAIVLYDRRNDGRLEMAVSPANVPTFEEWKDRGRPTLIVQPDDRVSVCVELVLKGFPLVLVKDIVGSGKSRTAGEFFRDWGAIASILKEQHPGVWKGFYASDDYRRPSHELIEDIPQAVSGAGEVLDHTKTTPRGNPYARRAMPGETPDIPALCIHEDAFQALNAQGRMMGRGNNSPFCKECPQFKGCPYLQAVEDQKSEPVLRTHLSKVSVEEGEIAIAFVDEAGRAVQGDMTVESHISAIDREIGEVAKTDPDFYTLIAPILKTLKQGVERAVEEQGRYGLTHGELMGYLPDRMRLQSLIVNQYWRRQGAANPWEIPTILQLAGRLQTTIRRDLEAQLNEAPDPKQRKELVDKCLTIGVLPRLLKVIDGNGRVDVSTQGQKIRFRYRNRRHGKTISKLKTAFLMDATPDRRELARNMGVDEGDIVSISSPRPSFENLTFKLVRGFGKAGQNREHYQDGAVAESPYSTMQRILALVEKVSREAIAINANTQIGLLDLKAYVDRYAEAEALLGARALLTGYHFHDGRNTNRFKECSILFSVGTPVQNIGDLLSQWHLRTGKSYTSETAPPAFWAWVNRKVTTEILQEGGRSRAQHRPDEVITHYILSDLSQGQISTIRDYFPGCVVEEVDAYDVCPESAPKGEQTRRGVLEAIAAAVKAGDRPNISTVASQVGVTKGWVSQIVKDLNLGGFKALAKSLVRLYEALNNRTKLSDLTPDQVTMAYAVFPELVKSLDSGTELTEALETFAEVAEILGYQSFEAVFKDKAMLSAVPATVLTKLIGHISGYLPHPFLETLESQGKELMEAIA